MTSISVLRPVTSMKLISLVRLAFTLFTNLLPLLNDGGGGVYIPGMYSPLSATQRQLGK